MNKIIKRKKRYRSDICKILILGDTNSGKTVLIKRLTDNSYSEMNLVTIGMDYKLKIMKLENGKEITLQIWDSPIIVDTFPTNIKQYIKGIKEADCVLLLYDITNRRTYDCYIKNWNKTIINEAPNLELKYLIGNKIDAEDRRNVSYEESKKFAEENEFHFLEISCKNNIGIDLLLDSLNKEITELLY